jgi:hypothetical protein
MTMPVSVSVIWFVADVGIHARRGLRPIRAIHFFRRFNARFLDGFDVGIRANVATSEHD